MTSEQKLEKLKAKLKQLKKEYKSLDDKPRKQRKFELDNIYPIKIEIQQLKDKLKKKALKSGKIKENKIVSDVKSEKDTNNGKFHTETVSMKEFEELAKAEKRKISDKYAKFFTDFIEQLDLNALITFEEGFDIKDYIKSHKNLDNEELAQDLLSKVFVDMYGLSKTLSYVDWKDFFKDLDQLKEKYQFSNNMNDTNNAVYTPKGYVKSYSDNVKDILYTDKFDEAQLFNIEKAEQIATELNGKVTIGDIFNYSHRIQSLTNKLKTFSEDEDDDSWVCSCGNETDTILTVKEWCDEYNLSDEQRDKLVSASDEIDSDICQDCFVEFKNKILGNKNAK